MTNTRWIALLVLIGVGFGGCMTPPPQGREASDGAHRVTEFPETALDRYVAEPDPHYSWTWVRDLEHEACRVSLIEMVSQHWRQPPEVNRAAWRHWLVVVQPPVIAHDEAMLIISGGSNDDDLPDLVPGFLTDMARKSQAVVALLTTVPNQPLIFDRDGRERFEDGLLAYAIRRYVQTGDVTWLPRLPMVKSAVRAMDTVEAYCATEHGGEHTVRGFIVSGASKRGWTAWLTAAVDRRVKAIVPVVIDVLNVRESMRHHHAAYGFWTTAVGDYVQQELLEEMERAEMREAIAIEDPYAYRQRLDLPKYIVNASGDQFFPPDSWQYYLDNLPGETYLRYVPNTDHSLDGTDAIERIIDFHEVLLSEDALPNYTWRLESPGRIVVDTDDAPSAVRLWQATNDDARDFRLESLGPAWTSTKLAPSTAGRYVAEVRPPSAGWTAFFVELSYEREPDVLLAFTTGVSVVPDVLPHALPPGSSLHQTSTPLAE